MSCTDNLITCSDNIKSSSDNLPASVAQLGARPGDQEIADSTPAVHATSYRRD